MKKSVITAAALMILAACNESEENTPLNVNTLTVTTQIADSRVSTSGAASVFESGDQIKIYAGIIANPIEWSTNGVTNTCQDDGTWVPDAQMLWGSDADEHRFIGLYPATLTAATDVALDYTSAAEEDILYAETTSNPVATPVPLTFDHQMAKLTVNLTFKSEFTSIPTVNAVNVNAVRQATADFLTAAKTPRLTLSSMAQPTSKPITAATENQIYTCLLLPQMLAANSISVQIGSDTYIFDEKVDLTTPGKNTIINLSVGCDALTLEKENITITNWTSVTVENATATPYKKNNRQCQRRIL